MTPANLVAHRGYPERYPGNTLIGYEAAIAAGAHYIETDIQLTRDGQPVLFHDRTMERLCGHTGVIHEYTLDELRSFKAMHFGRFGYRYAQTPIATLASLVELLQRRPDVTAFIEFKRIAIEHFGVGKVVSTVLHSLKPVNKQCTVISYSLEALLAAKNYGHHSLGVVIDHWQDRQQDVIYQINPEYLFFDIDTLPRRGKLSFQDCRLAVFQTTDPMQARYASNRGIALIETDAIKEMIDATD